MMAELYRVSFQQDEDRKPEDWFNPQGLGGAMDRVRGRANKWPKGETRQRDRGEEWGNWRPDLNQALFQFKGAVEANRPGDIRVLQHRNRDLVLVRNVHVPDVDYPNISSNATPNVRQADPAALGRVPAARILGLLQLPADREQLELSRSMPGPTRSTSTLRAWTTATT